MDAIDAASLVAFRLYQDEERRRAQLTYHLDVLLNLQAGAGSECNNDWGDAMAVEFEVEREDAASDDECGVPEEQADESTVRVSQLLLTSMESEVNQELR